MPNDIYNRFYQVIRKIPAGRVATYGQVAVLAGLPGRARQVGYALNSLKDESVPWHRVINAQGKISKRADSTYEMIQRELLIAEGIDFDGEGRTSLKKFQWIPETSHLARRLDAS